MTIHLHTKHKQESGLGLLEYMVCLFYEQRNNYTAQELATLLSTTVRTIYKIKQQLVSMGYIRKTTFGKYELTDKMYSR